MPGLPRTEDALSVNDAILRECHTLYTDPDRGLCGVGEEFGLKLLPPRKKVVILLIGNHSAGKSSFINWYIDDNVQRTGVAIETQGFTIVTNGKKRETFTGEATLVLNPQLKEMESIPGVLEFLNTEISPSSKSFFKTISFIDTPGLVDGNMEYPYDVNQAILWLGNMADLIFVFFDPIGQALCKRTLTLVETLNMKHTEKMRFYLSKSDDAGTDGDRQRVLMQIVQELCKRPGLNRTAFDMPTFYLPNLSRDTTCVNQLEEVCSGIERTIKATIQNTLNTLDRDSQIVEQKLNNLLKEESESRSQSREKSWRVYISAALFLLVLTMLAAKVLLSTLVNKVLVKGIGVHSATMVQRLLGPVQVINRVLDDHDYTIFPCLCVVCLAQYWWVRRSRSVLKKPKLNRKQLQRYSNIKDYLVNELSIKRKQLYKRYLLQSVDDFDLA